MFCLKISRFTSDVKIVTLEFYFFVVPIGSAIKIEDKATNNKDIKRHKLSAFFIGEMIKQNDFIATHQFRR